MPIRPSHNNKTCVLLVTAQADLAAQVSRALGIVWLEPMIRQCTAVEQIPYALPRAGLRDTGFDLALVDLSLPGTGGCEAVTATRRRTSASGAGIVAVAAAPVSPAAECRLLGAGADLVVSAGDLLPRLPEIVSLVVDNWMSIDCPICRGVAPDCRSRHGHRLN